MGKFQRYTTRVGAAGLAQFQDSRLRQAGMLPNPADSRPWWEDSRPWWERHARWIIVTDGKPDHESNFVDKEDAQDHIVSVLRKRYPGPKYSYRKANKQELMRILDQEHGEDLSLERAESATDRYYDDRGSWRDSRSNPALKFKRQTDGSYLSSGKGESYFIKKERVTSKGRRKTMYALYRLTHSSDRGTPARSWRLVAHYPLMRIAKKAAGASPGRFNPAHEIKSKNKSKKKSSSRRNPMATKSPFVKAGETLKRLSPRAKLSNYPTLAKRKSRIKELRAQGRRANPVAINPTKRKKNPIKRKNSRTVHTAMKKADYMERLKNLGISSKSRRESLYQKYLKKMRAESVKRRTRSKSRRR